MEILLRKGRLGNVVSARDRFIREAVLQQGYLASQGRFVSQQPSIENQPCTAEDLVDLGKSDTVLCRDRRDGVVCLRNSDGEVYRPRLWFPVFLLLPSVGVGDVVCGVSVSALFPISQ